MIVFYLPDIKDLWFREKMLKDSETMAFNHDYGGTIDFDETRWEEWYSRWIKENNGRRFYRYLKDDETGEFIGEAAYYHDGSHYNISIIVYFPYRNKGYGTKAIELLCDAARRNGIDYLYDDIAYDNPSLSLFLKNGFGRVSETDTAILVRKKL